MQIQVNQITPNPSQPRKHFSETDLQDLARSIKQNGLILPIAVEETENGDYILIDGERRWRAHQLLGLETIEATVRPSMNGTGSRERTILALVANLQRADLAPSEEARGYQALSQMGMSNAAIAHRLGTNSTRVASRLALLSLPDEILNFVDAGLLPVDQRVTSAIRSLPESKQVQFVQKLARPGLKIKTVQTAAERLRAALNAERITEEPSYHLAVKRAGEPNLPHWDSLHSLGAVPPWHVVVQAAIHTCKTCELRSEASVVVCGRCPSVTLLAKLIEVSRG